MRNEFKTRQFSRALVAVLTAWCVTLAAWAQDTPALNTGPVVTKVRFFPRAGQAQLMKNGRFTGSLTSATSDFVSFCEIKDAPADGQWTELPAKAEKIYRFIKYESPNGSWGNVAEVEFYSGDKKLTGTPFGTIGSRDNSGNDFSKAFDGATATFFDGPYPNGHYAGIDLGEAVQVASPEFSVKPGAYPDSVKLTLTTKTPGARIRFTRGGWEPTLKSGEDFTGELTVNMSVILAVVAFKDGMAQSTTSIAAYRIGEIKGDGKTIRTYHIGNSLTDTVNGLLKPTAESAGKLLDFHRFTIPGAPTDWLWDHSGQGFGDPRYLEAFLTLSPIDHIFTQPFWAHDRPVENEADYSNRFFDACRKYNPDVQPWLYVQWPFYNFDDRWSQGKWVTKLKGIKPATSYQEGIANHIRYTEEVRDAIAVKQKEGKPVLIVPGGAALAELKTQIDAGKVPGMTDLFAECYSDPIHLSSKGRYLISLVFYSCIYKESPEGKTTAINSGLTDEQLKIFQKVAWDVVKDYKWAGVTPVPK